MLTNTFNSQFSVAARAHYYTQCMHQLQSIVQEKVIQDISLLCSACQSFCKQILLHPSCHQQDRYQPIVMKVTQLCVQLLFACTSIAAIIIATHTYNTQNTFIHSWLAIHSYSYYMYKQLLQKIQVLTILSACRFQKQPFHGQQLVASHTLQIIAKFYTYRNLMFYIIGCIRVF